MLVQKHEIQILFMKHCFGFGPFSYSIAEKLVMKCLSHLRPGMARLMKETRCILEIKFQTLSKFHHLNHAITLEKLQFCPHIKTQEKQGCSRSKTYLNDSHKVHWLFW